MKKIYVISERYALIEPLGTDNKLILQ